MKICAIVLDYHGAGRTGKCLHSLSGQGLAAALVIDNSNDAHASMLLQAKISELQSTKRLDFPVSIIKTEDNLGFARGVNLALAQDKTSQYSHFLIINNDATALPGMLLLLSEEMVKKQAELAAPLLVNSNGEPQPGFWYQRHLGLQTTSPLPFSFPYFSGCCLLISRSLLTEGKLFDEDFFMYGEDTMLGWQLMRLDKVGIYVTNAKACHEGRQSTQKNKLFYEYHTSHAHVMLALKTWISPFEIPLLLLTKAAGLIARALRRCWTQRNLLPLLAYFLAWFPINIRPEHEKRKNQGMATGHPDR